MPWPPTDDFMLNQDILPKDLQKFLNFLVWETLRESFVKLQRLIASIGQDILRAVTGGEWKLPKHILFCMTLRHVFRSKQLVTMMKRFGHCETYRFTPETETAIAKSMKECSKMCMPQILVNPSFPSVLHSEFDNFDVFVNTLEGQVSTHTAHGIMLQEITEEDEERIVLKQRLSVERKRKVTVHVDEEDLPECYMVSRRSPDYPLLETNVLGGRQVVKDAERTNLLWLLCRLYSSLRGSGDQDVPGWGGFISLHKLQTSKETTHGYYPVINKPITDYKTVQECLRQSE